MWYHNRIEFLPGSICSAFEQETGCSFDAVAEDNSVQLFLEPWKESDIASV